MILHIGYKNYIPVNKILAITSAESAPLRRQRQTAEDNNKLIDCTMGRKTLSLIHLSEGYIVLSSVNPDTLKDRIEKAEAGK